MDSSPFSAYIKVAVLIIASICTHISFISPTSNPPLEERAKYAEKRKSFFGDDGLSATHSTCAMTYIFHLVSAFHALAILSALALPIPQAFRELLPEGVGSPTLSYELLLGFGLLAIGTIIRILSYRALDRFFTFYLAIREGHRLVTTGPYSIVRHPSYTGGYLGVIGLSLIHLGPGSTFAELHLWYTTLGRIAGMCQCAAVFYVVWTIYVRMPKEDAVLRERFGDEWQAWAKRTPYKLLPGVY
ncbi:isoprenylcysteine carboxylmethyltransferase family protein [Phanerochaete sordida]|uniref:Isoprenylcysteine carboxylmethyltransferase family protein n=1 Tax=Phanerochaete sordida TaxID=48140 RepID=A0A9P3LDH8_9APHY|nr:isoprenylcysteine carboxylmethyltransferase family protein [Phanerochaete sordida]